MRDWKESLYVLQVMAQWSIFNYILFFLLSTFMPSFFAVTIAMIITVGAFTSEKNLEQWERIKRPLTIISFSGSRNGR